LVSTASLAQHPGMTPACGFMGPASRLGVAAWLLLILTDIPSPVSAVTGCSEGYRCASEGGTCYCDGAIYFGKRYASGKPGSGVETTWGQMMNSPYGGPVYRTFDDTPWVYCSSSHFGGDPLNGYFKKCMCVATCAPLATTAAEKESLLDDGWSVFAEFGNGNSGSFGHTTELINSAADLTAQGWTSWISHYNWPSFPTYNRYMQWFYSGTLYDANMQKTLPRMGAHVLVTVNWANYRTGSNQKCHLQVTDANSQVLTWIKYGNEADKEASETFFVNLVGGTGQIKFIEEEGICWAGYACYTAPPQKRENALSLVARVPHVRNRCGGRV
jgi:hypothetical protein